MESVPSPISVHNTESKGHTESLDVDEAINMYMDDDDIDTIESISSVSLMRYLKFRKKLSEADVEEAEDLIKDIHMENTRQKWIKRGCGGSGGVDRTGTKSAEKVSTQVKSQSLRQSEINTKMESSIS